MGMGLNPSQIPGILIAGRFFTDIANLIQIYAYTGNSVTGNLATFRQAGASAGYTPSGAKTLKVLASQCMVVNGGAAGKSVVMGYGDTDVGFSSTSAPTNPKYVANNATGGGQLCPENINSSAANPTFDMLWDFVIPNGKYPFINVNLSLNVHVRLFGYEI